jgi:DNA polymerase-3 subunit epsilon
MVAIADLADNHCNVVVVNGNGEMNFLAIDVETACAEQGSICQLGVAFFVEGRCVRTESRLVNPEMEFSTFHTGIHGICSGRVANMPIWRDVYSELFVWARERVLVSHTFFDRTAVQRACMRYSVTMFPYAQWIDSCAAARRAWPHLPNHRLTSLATHFGLEYKAHDAVEDARIAGEIFLRSQRNGVRPM